MNTKHTPPPWVVSDDKCDGLPTIRTKNGHWVVATTALACPHDVVNGHEEDDACEANAEFIVRACNSHYELLEALEAIRALALPSATHIHRVIDNAIAKASKLIHKTELMLTDCQTIQTAGLGKLLTVQMQKGKICLWYEAYPNRPPSERLIYIFGTGHPMPEDNRLEYLGTFQMEGGSLVFHVYEML